VGVAYRAASQYTMPVAYLAIVAAVEGLTEALPISRSGHGAVARIWLGSHANASALEAFLLAGVFLALAWVIRRRLRVAIGEAVRAVSRPSLFRTSPGAHDAAVIAIAAFASIATSLAAQPFVGPWKDVPSVVAVGLLFTGVALASTAAAPRGRTDSPTLRVAVLIGIAHGLAVVPGASSVGAALTVAIWLGVRPVRAAELAFAVSLPGLAVAVVGGLAHGAGVEASAAVAAVLLAFLGARLGAAALRALLARERLALLSLWLMPLSLATLAYARALPA
jgi:undecaprenyl-diphosphatase